MAFLSGFLVGCGTTIFVGALLQTQSWGNNVVISNGVVRVNGKRIVSTNDSSIQIRWKNLKLVMNDGRILESDKDLELKECAQLTHFTVHTSSIEQISSEAADIYVGDNTVLKNVHSTSGSIHVGRNVGGSVSSTSGDIEVKGEVKGLAQTTSGDISAQIIYGQCQTVSGDIRGRR
jgi:hypothetical protein